MDSVIVPILNEELTILSFVVPKDFANRIEMKAAKIIEGFENHPSGEMDPNNKMMQSMSFVIQTSFDFYDSYIEEVDEDTLPDIDEFE
ncbi:MAG: hypothetical protein CMB22_02515 [Euryarchaeota archaeon]|nr:hypothetical protein [Euryarchaeota archaeon]|tara:strand:+ start:7979 stop:8242 length:264 start_codon:yes stop_codon:yes gene_type:complete